MKIVAKPVAEIS